MCSYYRYKNYLSSFYDLQNQNLEMFSTESRTLKG